MAAEGLAHAADVGELDGEVVVHPAARGLVFPVLLVAERRPLQVERDAAPLGLLVLVELAQHGREAVGGAGRKPARRGEAPDREERAVELGAAVDKYTVFSRAIPRSYL
jgi:hypothetical protein